MYICVFHGHFHIFFMYVGPPFPPSDLAVVPIGVGSLRISWVAPFFYPNETLYYNLTVFNLRHSISEPLLNETNLLVQHFFFSNDSTEILNNSGLCDVYRFIVTVRNDFGMSGPSEIIDRSLPTVPNISDVESTIQLMLLKTTNRVFVVILFDSNVNNKHPNQHYTKKNFNLSRRAEHVPHMIQC